MIGATNNHTATLEVLQPIIGDRSLHLTSQSDWSMPRDSEHIVQFYETDTFLLHTLSDYVETGLAAGVACLVVATKAHRVELDERLQAAGIDVVTARATEQYVALDAAETLATFMVAGSPDSSRFAAVIGDIIAHVAHGRRAVRIFGEMVGLFGFSSGMEEDPAIV